MAAPSAFERLTGLRWKGQGPVFLVGLGHCAVHWTAVTFYLLVPFITADLGLTYTEAGALVAVFHASSVLANLGSGPLVDVSGRRVLFQVVAVGLGGAALFGFAGARGLPWLVVMVAVIGGANNLWHPAAISFLSRRHPENRGYALSIHALGANMGDAIGPLAAGALLVWLSWQGTAAVGALPVLAVALLLGVTLMAEERAGAGAVGRGMGLGEYARGLRRMVADRAVLGLCLMAGFRTVTQNGLFVFLPLYLAHELGAGPLWVGLALTLMQLGGVVAAPIAGTWSDRVGRRPVVLAGLTASTAVIFGLAVLGNIALFIIGVSLLGFVLFAVRPVVHGWLMDLTPPRLGGSATSLMFGVQSSLSALALPVGGAIADAWGLAHAFTMLAGTALAANLLVLALPGDRRGGEV